MYNRRNKEPAPPLRDIVQRGNYPRIFAYFLPYWKHGLLLLLSILAMAILGLVPPLLVIGLIDNAIPNADNRLLTILAIGMVLAPVTSGLVSVGQSYLNSIVGQAVMYDIRNQMYTHLQKQSLRFYTTTRTGEIMSRINDDVGGIQDVVTSTMVTVVTNIIVVTTTLVMISILDWRLTLVGVALLPLFIWPAKKAGGLRRNIRSETQVKRAERSAHMQETLSISGILLVRSFVQEAFEAARFRSLSQDIAALNIRLAMVGRWFFMLLGLYTAIGPAIVYWHGGRLVIDGDLSIGTIVAFVALLTRLFGPVSSLASVHVELTTSLALFERIFAYLDLQPDIENQPNAHKLEKAQGHIRLDDVSFTYNGTRQAVSNISVEAMPGQLIALVGPSGAGKSTFANLLARFYDPTQGAIYLDGHDLREIDLESLHSRIGIVPQDSYLFHDTVKFNVAYGRNDATDAEIVAACRAAQIHDFIASLPDAYDTMVGERGHRLSGGEKQRLAIARVLLKNPNILILDEATSSVDSTAEAQIQRALQTLTRGRTTFAIAHRLSTILAADQILVLDNGQIVESGRHADLLTHEGLYAQLFEEQFKPGLATV